MSLERVSLAALPEIGAWMKGWLPPVAAEDFLVQNVSVAKALAVLRLYWPEFVEVQGGVFIAGKYSNDSFQQWAVRVGNDPQRLEEVMNLVHLWDVFAADLPDDITDTAFEPALRELGQLLAESWRAALLRAMPDLSFEVQYAENPSDYGPTVTFWRVR